MLPVEHALLTQDQAAMFYIPPLISCILSENDLTDHENFLSLSLSLF